MEPFEAPTSRQLQVSSVAEKSQVQAPSQSQSQSQSQSALPIVPGMPEKRTHYCFRHGTTNLFAGMNLQDWTVIASTHRRHRAVEFKKFLSKIDQKMSGHVNVHVV